jgi:hypothetical protein
MHQFGASVEKMQAFLPNDVGISLAQNHPLPTLTSAFRLVTCGTSEVVSTGRVARTAMVAALMNAARWSFGARPEGFVMRHVLSVSAAVLLVSALGGCGGGGGASQIAASPSGNDATAATATTSSGNDTRAAPLLSAAATSVSLYRVFSPQSFWYQPIPASAPLNPNSAAYTQNLVNQIKTYYNNVNLNTTSYAASVYFVRTQGGSNTVTWDNGTPVYPVAKTVNVGFNDCQEKGWTDPKLIAQWQNVPIPVGAKPASGTDSEMSIYDLSTQTLWDFWVMSQANGQWQACWGGRIQNTPQNAGIFPNPYGTTATGLPFIGGEISAEELAKGQIDHVMGISLVNAASWNVFSWPANRSDGYNPTNAPNQIPEGTRLRLDPSVNVDALNLTPVGRMIAKAAQTYGFVIWDKAGSVSLRMVNPNTYMLAGKSDPYPALFGGMASWQVLQNFPWDKMQFMPNNYGKPN